MMMGAPALLDLRAPGVLFVGAACSINVFHLLHSGQQPSHLMLVCLQEAQA